MELRQAVNREYHPLQLPNLLAGVIDKSPRSQGRPPMSQCPFNRDFLEVKGQLSFKQFILWSRTREMLHVVFMPE